MCDCGREGDCVPKCDCEQNDDHGHEGNCCHKSAQLRGIMHLALLALLKEKEAYGSDLFQSLKERFGVETLRPVVYMTLRRLEREGFLISHWDMEGGGPAKRVYKITEDGILYLNDSIEELKKTAEVIGRIVEDNSK